MTYQHKDLAASRWKTMSFCEQMANIGSEVERALELIELTIDCISRKTYNYYKN